MPPAVPRRLATLAAASSLMRMMLIIITCLFAFEVLTRVAFAQTAPATAPANGLVGSWRVLSIGKKALPANTHVIWTIDRKTVVVTLNGEVTTESTYVLKPNERHPTIELTEKGKSAPDRVGWYEVKDDRLRLQLTVFTGEPPEAWNDDEVMVLVPAAPK
jgi:hypothetical protein